MIRNYPGFPHGISGHELTRRACEQAWMFGAHMVFSQPAVGLECRGDDRVVHLADGRQIVAEGGHRRDRASPGAVSACRASRRWSAPACSTARPGARPQAMEGRDVFVVGAGNSAGQTALHLARYARQVTMLVRGGQPGALDVGLPDPGDRGHLQHHGAPAHRGHRRPRSGSPRSLTLHDRLHDRTEQVPAAALFVLIGGEPRTQWMPEAIQLETRLHPDRARRRAGWRARRRGGRSIARLSRSRRRCPASSPWETPVTVRSSGSPPPSVTAPRRCASCTSTSPPRLRRTPPTPWDGRAAFHITTARRARPKGCSSATLAGGRPDDQGRRTLPGPDVRDGQPARRGATRPAAPWP